MELEYPNWARLQGVGPHTGGHRLTASNDRVPLAGQCQWGHCQWGGRRAELPVARDSDRDRRSRSQVPCGLADAYLAMTDSEMQDSHTACGDCRGMSLVLKQLQQQCKQRRESL